MGSLEDIEAIRRLMAQYCFYTDARNPDLLCTILAEDFVFSGIYGRREGHAGMHALYEDNPRPPSARHMSHNLVIDVRGDEATCFSYMLLLDKDSNTLTQ